MNSHTNLRLTQQFLEKLGSGASAEVLADLCAPDLEWNVPGDSGVLPWVGHKKGRKAMADFIRDTESMLHRESLEIHDVLASHQNAIILGHLKTHIKATGKVIDGTFAIVLTFSDQKIARFLMLEDSFAVSCAAAH